VRTPAFTLVAFVLPLAASADVIYLKSGGAFSGRIVSRSATAIEMDIGRGGVAIGRQRNLNPSPVEIEGRTLDVPNDPDEPVSPDAIDAELPGEGPEDLSGPDDDDPLPE